MVHSADSTTRSLFAEIPRDLRPPHSGSIVQHESWASPLKNDASASAVMRTQFVRLRLALIVNHTFMDSQHEVGVSRRISETSRSVYTCRCFHVNRVFDSSFATRRVTKAAELSCQACHCLIIQPCDCFSLTKYTMFKSSDRLTCDLFTLVCICSNSCFSCSRERERERA